MTSAGSNFLCGRLLFLPQSAPNFLPLRVDVISGWSLTII